MRSDFGIGRARPPQAKATRMRIEQAKLIAVLARIVRDVGLAEDLAQGRTRRRTRRTCANHRDMSAFALQQIYSITSSASANSLSGIPGAFESCSDSLTRPHPQSSGGGDEAGQRGKGRIA